MFLSFYEIMYGQKPRRDEKFEDIKRSQLEEIEKKNRDLEDIKQSIEELKMLIIHSEKRNLRSTSTKKIQIHVIPTPQVC